MNLTITVGEEVLRSARIRALEEHTSVNAVLRDYLTAYAGLSTGKRGAADRLLQLSRNSRSRRGDAQWTRDDLHER